MTAKASGKGNGFPAPSSPRSRGCRTIVKAPEARASPSLPSRNTSRLPQATVSSSLLGNASPSSSAKASVCFSVGCDEPDPCLRIQDLAKGHLAAFVPALEYFAETGEIVFPRRPCQPVQEQHAAADLVEDCPSQAGAGRGLDHV